jgi:hypothetical protein
VIDEGKEEGTSHQKMKNKQNEETVKKVGIK